MEGVFWSKHIKTTLPSQTKPLIKISFLFAVLPMAPICRDLQLTMAGGCDTSGNSFGRFAGDLEDVRLLDASEGEKKLGKFEGLEDSRKTIQERVTGMTCAACSNSVEGALKTVNGDLQATVALLKNRT